MHLLIYLLTYTYLHRWLCAYKTGNICETVEYRTKAIINGRPMYKVDVVRWLFDCRQNVDLE